MDRGVNEVMTSEWEVERAASLFAAHLLEERRRAGMVAGLKMPPEGGGKEPHREPDATGGVGAPPDVGTPLPPPCGGGISPASGKRGRYWAQFKVLAWREAVIAVSASMAPDRPLSRREPNSMEPSISSVDVCTYVWRQV